MSIKNKTLLEFAMTQTPVGTNQLNHKAIARKWVESFETLEARMMPEITPFLSDDFELICPGDSAVIPFAGIWKGAAGHQQWLDLFFGFFNRTKAKRVTYTSSDHTVVARWQERVTLQGTECDPVKINLYFHFYHGKLARIFDDYDTDTGTASITSLLAPSLAPD